MITIFRVFLSDAKRLRSNVVAIVIIMGLSIIPALYAWFNIMSNWDPYGPSATSQMKVAVCSQDAGVELGSLSLNIGDEVITGLKENTTIGWVFSDSKEDALEGVNSGDYYAALVVPDTFTADFISFLGGDPKNPMIGYYENSKKNAIATKITGKAKTAVQEQVNQKFISTLTEVLTESGKILADNDENGVDIVASTAAQLDEMDSSLQTYVNILNTFSLVTGSASDLAESAQSLLINTQGLFDSSQDSVSNMQSSVLSGAQTADTVSSLISISLDSVDQDLGLLSDQLDTLTVGSTYDDIKNQVDKTTAIGKNVIAVLKDLLKEGDQKVTAVNKSFEQLDKDYISGITFSGGDPLYEANRADVTALAKEIKERYPKKDIWVYTGYEWESVCDLELMDYTDVVVDGRFILAQRDVTLEWKGSPNQRVIDVKKTRARGEVVLLGEK